MLPGSAEAAALSCSSEEELPPECSSTAAPEAQRVRSASPCPAWRRSPSPESHQVAAQQQSTATDSSSGPAFVADSVPSKVVHQGEPIARRWNDEFNASPFWTPTDERDFSFTARGSNSKRQPARSTSRGGRGRGRQSSRTPPIPLVQQADNLLVPKIDAAKLSEDYLPLLRRITVQTGETRGPGYLVNGQEVPVFEKGGNPVTTAVQLFLAGSSAPPTGGADSVPPPAPLERSRAQ